MPESFRPTAFYVLDNSKSMSKKDGFKYEMKTGKSLKCSRWEEMKKKVQHLKMVDHVMHTHSMFFLLNPVGKNSEEWKVGRDLVFLNANLSYPQDKLDCILDEKNRIGHTPLTKAMCFIEHCIRHEMKSFGVPKSNGFKVILLTDGVPDCSSTMFKEVSFLCNHWGADIVVNLIGEDENAKSLYKLMDETHDKVDVLAHYETEKKTIKRLNPWLNYDYWMHINRLGGMHTKEFDGANEHELDYYEIRDLLNKLVPSFRMPDLPPGGGERARQLFEDQIKQAISFSDPEFALTGSTKILRLDSLIERVYPLAVCRERDVQEAAYDELNAKSPFSILLEDEIPKKAKKGKKDAVFLLKTDVTPTVRKQGSRHKHKFAGRVK